VGVRFRTIAALLLSAAAVLGACGSDHKAATTASSASATASAAATASGPVTVFAAASLTEAFDDEQQTLKTEQPGLDITYSFGGSGALVTQIQQGAPADVIATADAASMQKLVDAGLVETPRTIATNELQILVAPGNPKNIKGLSDLARGDITFVTEDDTVPAGKYAAQALQNADVKTNPVSKETDVKSAVAKVTSGEADATIVYLTDVKATGSKGAGVAIPDDQNVVATYPIAIVKSARDRGAAQAFVEAIVGGSGQQALRSRGFLPPS
jgi:molybdate transport system substrate-binding protein